MNAGSDGPQSDHFGTGIIHGSRIGIGDPYLSVNDKQRSPRHIVASGGGVHNLYRRNDMNSNEGTVAHHAARELDVR